MKKICLIILILLLNNCEKKDCLLIKPSYNVVFESSLSLSPNIKVKYKIINSDHINYYIPAYDWSIFPCTPSGEVIVEPVHLFLSNSLFLYVKDYDRKGLTHTAKYADRSHWPMFIKITPGDTLHLNLEFNRKFINKNDKIFDRINENLDYEANTYFTIFNEKAIKCLINRFDLYDKRNNFIIKKDSVNINVKSNELILSYNENSNLKITDENNNYISLLSKNFKKKVITE